MISWSSRSGKNCTVNVVPVLSHRSVEPVTTLWNGSDVLATIRLLAQGFAQQRNVDREIDLFDETVGPDSVH
ncbi:MAG TPA: hypothetical protein VHT28_17060 [Silvibacterium sp.]|nr:hypothetical protein [Silvibacterium sp.]